MIDYKPEYFKNQNPIITEWDEPTIREFKGHKVLGRKTAGVSYSTDNTLIQSKYFNESVQELDQDVSNIVHWAWFAEMNMRLANKFKNDDDYLEARSDAIKLQKKFNRSKLNEEELQELKDYSEFMGNWNDVYKTNNEEK